MRKLIQAVGILFLCFLMTSCAQKSVTPFDPVDLSQKFNGKYKAKVDNFLVIFDASSSMFMDYNNEMKFKQSKRTLNNMNQTMPALDIIGGIRVFGPKPYTLHGKDPLLYGMSKYNRADFASSLAQVTETGGGTPMATALDFASEDLSQIKGKNALIVISDAEDLGMGSVESAQAIKAAYKDNICIYTILIGGSPRSKAVMDSMAKAGGCGFATDYAALNSPAGMADFVEKVFLEMEIEKDSDGDGVFDSADRCPKTPRGDKVDKNGCTIVMDKDSDKDGVLNEWDSCPGTPYGLKVDKYGCPLKITKKTSIELRVEFDVDKYFIRPEYHTTLKEFANFMNDNQNLVVTIEGHADNTGTESYNQVLSEKRAKSVVTYLNTYFNVDTNRLKSVGHGELQPETTNDTEAGKQKNRRVMAEINVGK